MAVFHTGYFVREEEMFVKSQNIYKSSYHYVHFNIEFSVGGVGGGVGGGGGECLPTYWTKSCKALSVLLGGLWEENSSACGMQ